MFVSKKLSFNDRQVEIIFSLEKHTCDSFVASGYYLDNFEDLTDGELDKITDENQDIIMELALENGQYRE